MTVAPEKRPNKKIVRVVVQLDVMIRVHDSARLSARVSR
jgi:hypothetical protein